MNALIPCRWERVHEKTVQKLAYTSVDKWYLVSRGEMWYDGEHITHTKPCLHFGKSRISAERTAYDLTLSIASVFPSSWKAASKQNTILPHAHFSFKIRLPIMLQCIRLCNIAPVRNIHIQLLATFQINNPRIQHQADIFIMPSSYDTAWEIGRVTQSSYAKISSIAP